MEAKRIYLEQYEVEEMIRLKQRALGEAPVNISSLNKRFQGLVTLMKTSS